jgi:archaellum biogenesis ATPase FlaH
MSKPNGHDIHSAEARQMLRTGKIPEPPKPVFTWASVPCVFDFEAHVTWLVADLIPEAAITLITGDAGTGKSIFATALAGAIVRGEAFLGFESQRRRVVYLDRENPLAVVKQHLNDLYITRTADLIYWGGWCEVQADGPGAASLIELAAAEKPLFIFDSLIAFNPGDEQDATETRGFLRLFRRLANAGATVVILHHTGKCENAKDYRGSSDIIASVDIAWKLSKGGEAAGPLGDLKLTPFKNRIGSARPLFFRFESGAFMPPLGPEAPKPPIEILRAIIRVNPGLSGRKLKALVMEQGISKHKTEEMLAEGLKRGEFELTGRGGFKLGESRLDYDCPGEPGQCPE